MTLDIPTHKPTSPYFCCGPTHKRPGWSTQALNGALISRSHRSKAGVERIQTVLSDLRCVLEIPKSHQIALVSGSATAAVEMLMWNLLGDRPVDALVWDVFGGRWWQQMHQQLQLQDLRCLQASEGMLPNLSGVNFDHDVVFVWNGSTSGTCVPNGLWIDQNRRGLTICDATSAAFIMALDWDRLDATAFSWQKGLGSEAGHGVIVLGPRAIERLNAYQPKWPIPWLYRLRTDRAINTALFQGMTLNTPSMLCLEDCLDALTWAKSIGGLPDLIQRSQRNLQMAQKCVNALPWLKFMAASSDIRSSSTLCIQRVHPHVHRQDEWAFILKISAMLESHQVAYDCHNHTGATPAFRIWGGPTISDGDIRLFFQWLNWAYHSIEK